MRCRWRHLQYEGRNGTAPVRIGAADPDFLPPTITALTVSPPYPKHHFPPVPPTCPPSLAANLRDGLKPLTVAMTRGDTGVLRRRRRVRFGLCPTYRAFCGAAMQDERHSAPWFPVGTPARDPDNDNILWKSHRASTSIEGVPNRPH